MSDARADPVAAGGSDVCTGSIQVESIAVRFMLEITKDWISDTIAPKAHTYHTVQRV